MTTDHIHREHRIVPMRKGAGWAAKIEAPDSIDSYWTLTLATKDQAVSAARDMINMRANPSPTLEQTIGAHVS